MEIIKKGILPSTIPHEKTCSKCGTIFTYVQADVQGDQRDGPYVICPLTGCGQFLSVGNTNTYSNQFDR